MDNLAEQLIRDYKELVSLPEITLRINEMVNDPDCDIDSIGKLISQDPALAVRLLGIANSPFYGFSTEVSTVTRAIAVLGINKIRDIVLSASATKAFDGIPVDIIAVDDFWQHSLYCGVLGQTLAKQTTLDADAVFIAGLLHDIGQLILFNRYPQEMHDIILRTIEGEAPLTMVAAEQERLGTNHTQVGAELARSWHLPTHIEEAIAWHHEPENAPTHQQEVALIYIANAVAQMLDFDCDSVMKKLEVADNIWHMAQLEREQIPPAIEAASEQLDSLRQLYFG
ncbi:MAG: HDOD domain-containing protein [Gammaproteobacteria bacterium]|nr:HDOD domain-containing protein [Gammaproteobacteria bacterium]